MTAVPDGGPGLVLVRFWEDKPSQRVSYRDPIPADAHPPIPGRDVLDRLRGRIFDVRTPRSEPIAWWHRDGGAWATVTDLHRAGRHDNALALARLLHWCDSTYTFECGSGGARLWKLEEAS